MEEYRIFLMEQQGWYITQSNNLQYDNRITSAPLGRCRGIINTIFSNEKEKIKLFPPSNNTKVYTTSNPTFRIFRMVTYDSKNLWFKKIRV